VFICGTSCPIPFLLNLYWFNFMQKKARRMFKIDAERKAKLKAEKEKKEK